MPGENIRQIVVDFLIRDRATGALIGLNNSVNGLEQGAGAAAGAMGGMGGAAEGAAAGVGHAGDAAGDAEKKSTDLRNSMLGLGAAFSVAGAAGYLYFDTMAKGYARYTGTMTAFQTMTGDSSARILAQLQEVTRGTVSNADLVMAANKAMAMGIDQETLPRLAEIATAAARVMGIDTTYAFDSITTGIARNSPRWLDNLGIIVDLTEANEAYAASVGKSASELTSQEQQAALTNAVMEKGQAIMDKAGTATDNVATASGRASAAIEDLNMKMGEAAQGPMSAWYNLLGGTANVVSNLPEPVLAVAAGVGMLGTAVAGVTGPIMLQAAALMFLRQQWIQLHGGMALTPLFAGIASGGLAGLAAGLYAVAAAAWAVLTPFLPLLAVALALGAAWALGDISENGWEGSATGQFFGAANSNAAIPAAGTQNITNNYTPTQNVNINAAEMTKEEIWDVAVEMWNKMTKEDQATWIRDLKKHQ